uniref:Uncharacterized protein n=1 Tax=Neogobius melanostomus TaxID=47308 RepID=A0A8C6SHF9_9GOBI
MQSFHLISSAEKLTMVGMKFSLMMMPLICFQSVVLSPSSRQMDSRASLTACCFLMDLTAIGVEGRELWPGRGSEKKKKSKIRSWIKT